MAGQDAPITLAQLNAVLDVALNPIRASLDQNLTALAEKVTALDEKVTTLDEKVTALDEKVTTLGYRQDRADAKALNSQMGMTEHLRPIPSTNDEITEDCFPVTIAHLLVAGVETLPTGHVNTWNKAKSRRLLAAFGEEDSGNDSDGGEHGATSRRLRIRVAKLMGVTQTQLNFAQLTL